MKKEKLIIPLQFWFCKNIGLALPLYHFNTNEVKLNLALRPLTDVGKNHKKILCRSGFSKQ